MLVRRLLMLPRFGAQRAKDPAGHHGYGRAETRFIASSTSCGGSNSIISIVMNRRSIKNESGAKCHW